ncbi:hypothetical protein VKT23_007311 [Stygiomarasmius scandens]|uniref:DUF6533 domain-containing protein n=1 Tax=Marasmiellus scandens TaxID=2682957 RepID=A0ABR1JM15_9AGAR
MVCATAVFAWDLFSTAIPEYRFIWKKPFYRDKILYFWCRIFGMAGLLAYVCLPRNLKSSEDCRKLHHLRFSIIQISMAVMQLWTLHQTFLLFRRSRGTLIFLASAILLSVILQSTGTAFYFQYLELSAGDCKRLGGKPAATIAYTMGSLYLQVIVLIMSCTRWTQVARFGPQLQIPVVKLARIIARDNTVVSFLVLVFFSCSTIFGLRYGVSQHIWNYGWAWVFGFLNMAPYRMILNLRQAQSESEQQPQTQTFSSPLELTEINPESSTFDSILSSGTQSTLDSDSVSTVVFAHSTPSGVSNYKL